MVRVSQTPYHFELKEIQFKLIFCFISIHIGVICAGQSVTNVCNICTCDQYQTNIDCYDRKLTSVPKAIPATVETLDLRINQIRNIERDAFKDLINLNTLYLRWNQIRNIEKDTFKHLINLKTLYLSSNGITNITEGAFTNLVNLETLYLGENKIRNIEEHTFKNLVNLKTLYLSSNGITNITEGAFTNLVNLETLYLSGNNIEIIGKDTFKNLVNLKYLYLNNNQIIKYEDGAFLFLPSITYINLSDNNNMICGCHLPAMVDYLKRTYNRQVTVHGNCRNKQNKLIPILEYSECKDYSLFQRKLRCQTCSGITCKDSKVTSCPGAEPVCMNRISMSGVTLKSDKSCSTYRECVAAKKHNTFPCNKLTNGTSCVTCCTGHLCNKNDFIDYSLFQRKLQCQTCSGITCNDSEVTSCPGEEPVCMNRISMIGVTLKSDKSCSTYRECVAAKKNITFPCNKLTSGTSCVTCCAGQLCNKNDFIDYSLFQRKLQCQTCSGITCNDSEVTSCPGEEPVCMHRISMSGVTLKSDKSCSTYRECVAAKKNSTFPCNKLTSGTSCVTCCTGDLCNKNEFIDYPLFQRKLQCQTCSGITCNDSEVTSCPGAEPVCMNRISMSGVTLKSDKSCSTYRECVAAKKNSTFPCNKLTSGTSCVTCCTGDLCNKNDSIDYSLFQRKLQCQTCSGITCNDSEVTSCPGEEPVCMNRISMSGVTLKSEKSCSTYRECVAAKKNSTFPCNKLTSGTSCVTCCTGDLCNKNEFIDYSLFQRKLQCQTCSGITCKDSEVTSCPGEEPVCMNRISMSGVTLKSDKSCSTYRECVAAKKNSTFPCNKLTSGTSCVTCCTGDLCNKNDSIDYPLFQRKLQCQTCSGITCNDSGVTSCPGEEPVCMNRISMSGVTLKSDKSCSTYRECVAAKKNSTFPCNKLTSGTSCVTCCTGDLCNKNDSIDYPLFQRKLQCQTCSGITCNDSEVTSCPGEEPVCMNRISMSGVTLKSDKSCSTYRECVAAKKNSTFPCNKLTSGTSCVTCCTGDLCNKNDSIDYPLFQRKLQCQTCSGITCNDSEVTSCPGEEPVCMNRISMSGVTLKSDKSCSTYRECVAAKKNSTFPCNKLTSGTSCVTCCTGDLCNKNDSIDYPLFQRKLQCQTCSGITCNDSGVTSCPGEEPVCMNRISMSGVTLKSDKSCSTYRECVAAKKNSTFPCNKLTSGTSCVTCCTGDLCNKNDSIDYSLFQRKLQCQTCSGITCNDSEVTSCPGEEPVCMNRISMSGVTLKSEKSCSTYRECVAAKKNSTFPCNKLTSGTSCVTCCTGDLCNKNDSIDYSLFQRKLQCQTCSGITCNDSEVTRCPGEEPVCMNRISMSGVTLKSDKSCSTYRECVAAKKNSTFPCNKLTSGTSCVTCCTGDLCNKNDSIVKGKS